MPPDEPVDEEELEELPEDGDTPFRPATDTRDDLSDENLDREIEDTKADDTFPQRDTNQQPEELYDEGEGNDEPNAGNAVTGYDPDNDTRNGKRAKD